MMEIKELEETQVLNLQFEKSGGLLPVVVQESITGKVLIVASVNEAAFAKALDTGKATFRSTNRDCIWVKGETSGNSLFIDEILVDCDQDAIVYKVSLEKGGVCHTFNQFGKNRKASFYRSYNTRNQNLDYLEK